MRWLWRSRPITPAGPRGDEAAKVFNVPAAIVLLAWAGIMCDFGPVISRMLDNVRRTVAYTGAAKAPRSRFSCR